jgi:hypothetical protein
MTAERSRLTSRRVALLLGTAAAILVLTFAASPWLTLSRIESAIAQRDSERFGEYLDLPSLRESVKDELGRSVSREASRRAADDPVGALGAAFGAFLVEAVADPFLEALLKPSRLIDFLSGDTPDVTGNAELGKSASEVTKMLSTRYESFSRFAVTVRLRNGRTLDLLMRRAGFGWKVYRVRLPPKEEDRSNTAG